MRKNKVFIIVGILLFIGLGYALLTQELTINGTAGISSNTWDVHFNNISNQNGVTPTVEPSITDNTSISYTVNLDNIGDYYEFTIDVVNSGSIDAMIDVVSNTLVESDSKTYSDNLITYWVKYVDEVELEKYNLLSSESTDTIKIHIELNRDIDEDDLPSEDLTLTGSLSITYVQADDSALEREYNDFFSNSWNRIQQKVQNGDLNGYHIGDTKCVTLNGFTTSNDNGCEDGKFLVRIANMSTPSECAASDFSESACGFVVEFVDIITNYNMNPVGEYLGTTYPTGWNKDSWPGSAMYKYINPIDGDTSSGTIYNALPSDLQNVIKDTRVVTGLGVRDSNYFTSTDKLYLLATAEVWAQGNSNLIENDWARNKTRQLDYYANLGVNTNNYSGAIKKINGSPNMYWLRSPDYYSNSKFFLVNIFGSFVLSASSPQRGVSPSFRVG